MVPATINAETGFDIRDIYTPTVYTHLVVLVNERTDEERSLAIETLSSEFYDVWREIQFQKQCDRTLRGFCIFDVLSLDNPAPF